MSKMKDEVRRVVFEKYKGKCAYCGIKLEYDNFHVDHINAKFRKSTQSELSKWTNGSRLKGRDTMCNYNPSCVSCNCSKSTFTIEKWREQLSLKKDRIKRDSSTYNILLRFKQIKESTSPIIFYFEKNTKS